MNETMAIVVFGCRVSQEGMPSAALSRRLQRAVQEWRRHPHALVIVSGGEINGAPAESMVMHRWLRERGVPEAHIVQDSSARTTLQNAHGVVPILHARHIERVVLVTERFHMKRSCFLLRQALRAAQLTHVRIERASAPDDLKGARRWSRWMRERFATGRDWTQFKVNQVRWHRADR